jgi:hypothetical protein
MVCMLEHKTDMSAKIEKCGAALNHFSSEKQLFFGATTFGTLATFCMTWDQANSQI